ncbi:MAG: LamB/YcsF family protein [Actinomycetota bacterium]|nr:LamB/YcsF family protein [Actinomycetota bacterium]MDA8277743.1 LamB/YcsF family protein [Actinomycetota bacterium]
MFLSADVGETFKEELVGFDAEVIPLVDVVNVACGGHGGTFSSITTAINLAKENRVKIAAHPSYLDPEHFGRRSLEVATTLLQQQLQDQLSFIGEIAGEIPRLIKAHGALYNDMFSNRDLAGVFLEAIIPHAKEATIVGAPGSALETLCYESEITFMREGFADRRYLKDGSLSPRSTDGSLLSQPHEIMEQVRTIVEESAVISATGEKIPLLVDTICFHGDNRPSVDALYKLTSIRRGSN